MNGQRVATTAPNEWELRLFDACAEGEVADFTADAARDPVLRADVLRRVLLGLRPTVACAGARPCTGLGIRLRGARVEGRITLDSARGSGDAPLPPISLRECVLGEGLSANDAYFSSIELIDCRFGRARDRAGEPIPEFSMMGAQSDGTLRLDGASPLEPDSTLWVRLASCRIDGSVQLRKALLRAPPRRPVLPDEDPVRYALDLRGAEIEGNVIVGPAVRVEGGLNLRDTLIRGDVQFVGSVLTAGEQYSLTLQFARVSGALFAWASGTDVAGERRTVFQGPANLQRARIEGGVGFGGLLAQRDDSGYAIDATGAVFGSIWQVVPAQADPATSPALRPLTCTGYFSLEGAQVSGTVDLSGCEFGEADYPAPPLFGLMRVGGSVLLRPVGALRFEAPGGLSLRGAAIEGGLDLDGARIASVPDAALDGIDLRVGQNISFGFAEGMRAEIGRVLLNDADVGGDVTLQGAAIGYFDARNMEIDGHLLLLEWVGTIADQSVRQRVEIPERLFFQNARAHGLQIVGLDVGPRGRPVNEYVVQFGGTRIEGSMTVRSMRADGFVDMSNMAIQGDCYFQKNDAQPLLPQSVAVAGTLLLQSASFDGDCYVRGTFHEIVADHLQVGDDFVIQAEVQRRVSLCKARVNGEVNLSDLIFAALPPSAPDAVPEWRRRFVERRQMLRLRDTQIERALKLAAQPASRVYRSRLSEAWFYTLPFYPSWELLALRFPWKDDERSAWITLIRNTAKDTRDEVLLDGSSAPLYRLSSRPDFALADEEAVRAYLRVFGAYVWDGTGPSFPVFTDPANVPGWTPVATPEGATPAPADDWRFDVERHDDGLWYASAVLRWGPNVYRADYRIDARGVVEMLRDEQIGTCDPRFVPDHGVRPFKLTLGRVTERQLPPDLDAAWTPLSAADLEDVRNFAEDLFVRHEPRSARLNSAAVDLGGTRCGVLDDGDGAGWLSGRFEGGSERVLLNLENFAYDTYARDLSGAGAGPAAPSRNVAEARLDWLELQYVDPDEDVLGTDYVPQPYAQLAKVSRVLGDFEAAREAEVRKLEIEWRRSAWRLKRGDTRLQRRWRARNGRRWLNRVVAGAMQPLAWLGGMLIAVVDRFYRLGFRYGLSTPRAIATVVVFIVLGTLGTRFVQEQRLLVVDTSPVATVAVEMPGAGPEGQASSQVGMPKSDRGLDVSRLMLDPPCDSAVEAALYAADVFIPLMDFRQEQRCEIRSRSRADVSRIAAAWSDLWVVEAADPKAAKRADVGGKLAKVGAIADAFFRDARTWHWLKAIYALLGWIVISLAILTITGTIRRQVEKSD